MIIVLGIAGLSFIALADNSGFDAPENAGSQPISGLAQGPFIGHVEPKRVFVWARAAVTGNYTLDVRVDPVTMQSFRATASADRDLCMVWTVDGLSPNHDYTYAIRDTDGKTLSGNYRFRTAPKPTDDGATRLFFGSCAREDPSVDQLWQQAAREEIDVVVLLGDTPYIDTTELDKQRARYAAFAGVEAMAKLLRSTPWYGIWDDHDFGANDVDGRLLGKERSRRAFIEYHANPSYGDGKDGIYTRFRYGPVEVFLLDTRYFAATEPSPFLGHHASLLGRAQWDWLRQGLESSTAPVKVLACGMIWNKATRPGKTDHWGSYPHERRALFEFLGEKKIGGVILVGGDIHRSRVLRHDTKDLAGYDIYELISSPMHGSVIEAANAPHPSLIKDMGIPNMFMLLEVEQRAEVVTSLQARFLNSSGKEHYRIDLMD